MSDNRSMKRIFITLLTIFGFSGILNADSRISASTDSFQSNPLTEPQPKDEFRHSKIDEPGHKLLSSRERERARERTRERIN